MPLQRKRGTMNRAAWLQDRRMQKFRDVLSRWERGDLSMLEAGELLGMSERQFRRYRDRYEEDGLDGLVDGRLGRAVSERGRGGGGGVEAGALPACVSGLEREAFSRASGARPQLPVGLHVGEDAVAHGGSCGAS